MYSGMTCCLCSDWLPAESASHRRFVGVYMISIPSEVCFILSSERLAKD